MDPNTRDAACRTPAPHCGIRLALRRCASARGRGSDITALESDRYDVITMKDDVRMVPLAPKLGAKLEARVVDFEEEVFGKARRS